MTDDILDRLTKIRIEFEKMLGKPIQDIEESPADVLARFGFTLDEAESWLDQEPNYNKPIIRDKELTERGKPPIYCTLLRRS